MHHKIIDAAHFVPQTRKRVYFVGFHKQHHPSSLTREFIWPTLPSTDLPILRSVLMPDCDHDVASLRLTATQYASVKSSYKYQRNPNWRIARVDGAARTLKSSYRTSYKLYSNSCPCHFHLHHSKRSFKYKYCASR